MPRVLSKASPSKHSTGPLSRHMPKKERPANSLPPIRHSRAPSIKSMFPELAVRNHPALTWECDRGKTNTLNAGLGSGYVGRAIIVGLYPIDELRKSPAVLTTANSEFASIFPNLALILSSA